MMGRVRFERKVRPIRIAINREASSSRLLSGKTRDERAEILTGNSLAILLDSIDVLFSTTVRISRSYYK